MDAVIRSVVVYIALIVLFRIAGKRSLAQITTFDFILLLIIAEATQQALLGQDYSITNALLVIITLIAMDVGISLWKQRSSTVQKLVDSVPVLIVENGRPLEELMRKLRVDESDVLSAARSLQGLERMEQIKYAVLERSGGISIVPMPDTPDPPSVRTAREKETGPFVDR